MTTVIYLENGLNPQNRQVVDVASTSIAALAPDWQIPYVAFVDGAPVLRADWELVVEDGQSLAFIEVGAIPQGGGGGGSDPLRTVMMLAVMYYTAGMGGAMLGIEGAAAVGGFGVGMANMAVTMAGMALVNAVIPPPKPTSPQQAAALSAPSPTYSLQAQGNAARLGASIPEHFGRHICFPDFAAQPYAEFQGNEQYLYQLLCVGRGYYYLEDFKIEDSPMSSFDDIELEVVEPHQHCDLFPAFVTTSGEVSGQTLDCKDGTISSRVVTLVGHGFAAGNYVRLEFTGTYATDSGCYQVTTANTVDTFTVSGVNLAATGLVAVGNVIGAFITNDTGTRANQLSFDFVAPRGLYYAGDTGALTAQTTTPYVEYITVNDAGVEQGFWAVVSGTTYTPWSDWTDCGTTGGTDTTIQQWQQTGTTPTYDNEGTITGYVPTYKTRTRESVSVLSHTAASTTAQRWTYNLSLPLGRYKVRVYRKDVESTDSRQSTNVAWAGMRAYYPDYYEATFTASGTPGSYTGAFLFFTTPPDYTVGQQLSCKFGAQAVIMTVNAIDAPGTTITASIAGNVMPADTPASGAVQIGKDYGDVTLIALKMRASNNLSMQSSRKVNLIATRKLPVWTGSAWTPINITAGYTSSATTTRSPAWALAYAAKQVGLTDAQIDLAGLLVLDATCTTRADTFDARFDNFMSFWEVATKICGAVRAKPYKQGGVLRVLRDQATTIPVAMFSQRSIVKGSFSINYLMPTAETASVVDVTYFDSVTWKPAVVSCWLNDAAKGITQDLKPSTTPAKVDLFGVVTRAQAHKEGLYLAACNRDRRRIIKFQTEMEGFIPSFGDLINVQHDMPDWGHAGEAVAWDAGNQLLTLSEDAVFASGQNLIALRARDGSVQGPFDASSISTRVIKLKNADLSALNPSTVTIYTGGSEERTHYSMGGVYTYAQPARVLSAKPLSLTTVEIECVNESDSVHTADVGQPVPVLVHSGLSNYVNAPLVTGVRCTRPMFYPNTVQVSWSKVAWADHYTVEASAVTHNVFTGRPYTVWRNLGSTVNNQLEGLVNGSTTVRVAAVGLSRGPWVEAAVGSATAPVPPASLSAVVEAGGIRVTWPRASALGGDQYELRVGASFDAGDLVIVTSGNSYLWKKPTPGTVYTLWVKSFDGAKTYSATATSTPVSVLYPSNVALIPPTTSEAAVHLSWTPETAVDHAKTVVKVGVGAEVSWADGVEIYSGPASSCTYVRPGSGTYYFYAKHFDTAGYETVGTSSVSVLYTQPAISNALLADSISTAQNTAAAAAAAAAAAQTTAENAQTTANSRLEAGIDYVLSNVVTLDGPGAYKTGTITWDGTTLLGSGVAMTAYGLIGAVDGVEQFVLRTNGTATFSGEILGSSFVTATGTGKRIEINVAGSNAVQVYNSTGYTVARIEGQESGINSSIASFGTPYFNVTPLILATGTSYTFDGLVTPGTRGHIKFWALSGTPGIPSGEIGCARMLAAVTDHLEYYNGIAYKPLAYVEDFQSGTEAGSFTTLSASGKINASTGSAGAQYMVGGWDVIGQDSYVLTLGGITAAQWTTVAFFTSGAEKVRIDSSGNVGIGITSPKRPLHVATGSGTSFPTLGTSNGEVLIGAVDGLWGMYIGGDYTTGSGWIQQMRNDSATAYDLCLQPVGGNVGIGTTTPAEKLDVVGTIAASTGVKVGNTASASTTVLDWYEEGSFTAATMDLNTNVDATIYWTRIGKTVHLAISNPKYYATGAEVAATNTNRLNFANMPSHLRPSGWVGGPYGTGWDGAAKGVCEFYIHTTSYFYLLFNGASSGWTPSSIRGAGPLVANISYQLT
ncbi:MAG: host specificity factor TipJ family phage tail protein [Rhodoferax sp.]|nr:host specificity factor TipJ family phage tail protein [Rhodoferax sp.]